MAIIACTLLLLSQMLYLSSNENKVYCTLLYIYGDGGRLTSVNFF